MTLLELIADARPAKITDREREAPSFIDIFAGCGGLSLGLKRSGWRGLFAVEKDQFAFDTLEANFLQKDSQYTFEWPDDVPKTPLDVETLMSTHRSSLEKWIGKVDLLAGGPPCQGFSHAGRRQADDPRNRLFESYLSLVELLQPKMVLIENVRGFTSDFSKSEPGSIRNFSDTLKQRLAIDYYLVDDILDVSDFGIPQSRRRFFLVGVKKGAVERSSLDSFFAKLKTNAKGFLAQRHLPLKSSARDALSDLEVRSNGVVPCVDSPGFMAIDYVGPKTTFQHAMRDGHEGAPGDTRLAKHRADISERFSGIIRQCQDDGRLNISISKSLRDKYGLKKVALRVLDPLGPAPTITSLPDDLLHYSEPRILTVRENARLQSFPDWFVFKGKYTTGGAARRREIPRFTQVANAVPPLMAEQIGEALLEIMKQQK